MVFEGAFQNIVDYTVGIDDLAYITLFCETNQVTVTGYLTGFFDFPCDVNTCINGDGTAIYYQYVPEITLTYDFDGISDSLTEPLPEWRWYDAFPETEDNLLDNPSDKGSVLSNPTNADSADTEFANTTVFLDAVLTADIFTEPLTGDPQCFCFDNDAQLGAYISNTNSSRDTIEFPFQALANLPNYYSTTESLWFEPAYFVESGIPTVVLAIRYRQMQTQPPPP